MKFRIVIDRESCKGCELCVSVCSCGVLSMSAGLNLKGFHFVEAHGQQNDCTSCRQCAEICPDTAIEIEQEDE